MTNNLMSTSPIYHNNLMSKNTFHLTQELQEPDIKIDK